MVVTEAAATPGALQPEWLFMLVPFEVCVLGVAVTPEALCVSQSSTMGTPRRHNLGP